MTDRKNPFDPKEENVILRKRAEPASVPEELEEDQTEATFGWLRQLWNWLKGHTATEARRLKEASVRKVEGEAAKSQKEAKKIDAEAELIYARKEKKKQEAKREELERLKERKKLETETLEQKAENSERIANAFERVEKAISRIRQKGGDVALDDEQLQRLLEAEIEKEE